MFCHNCGEKLTDDTKFCPKCGEKSEAANNAPVSTSQEPPQRRRLFGNNNSQSNETASPSHTSWVNTIKQNQIASVQEEGLAENEELGKFWPRFGAYVFDYALAGIGGWVLVGVLIGVFSPNSTFFDNMTPATDRLGTFGLVIIYHAICLSIFSTTLGKKIFGLRVVDAKTKQKVSIGQAIGRSFSYIISSFIFGFGFWAIIKNPKKQGWHDDLAKTLVVRDKTQKMIAGIILAIIAGIVLICVAAYSSGQDNSSQSMSNETSNIQGALQNANDAQNSSVPPLDNNSSSPTQVSQDTIASTIVNILCQDSDGNGSGGSGTMFTSDGVILTNNHIIPEDDNGNPTVDSCIVTLPDPTTGKIDKIYQAKPIVIPTLSQKYDLAFLEINSSYTDDSGQTYGDYPAKFTDIIDSGCENDNPTLGEPVTVYGYPAISGGGYYLTITTGVVSSLPNDGTIVTSAKVDHGDSGGLAVDENGCYIGVPSMISGDGNESLGVIISDQVVAEFLGKVENSANSNDNSNQ